MLLFWVQKNGANFFANTNRNPKNPKACFLGLKIICLANRVRVAVDHVDELELKGRGDNRLIKLIEGRTLRPGKPVHPPKLTLLFFFSFVSLFCKFTFLVIASCRQPTPPRPRPTCPKTSPPRHDRRDSHQRHASSVRNA